MSESKAPVAGTAKKKSSAKKRSHSAAPKKEKGGSLMRFGKWVAGGIVCTLATIGAIDECRGRTMTSGGTSKSNMINVK